MRLDRYRTRRGQQGMSLVAALFLIVVVAALGAFAVRIGAGQQQTVNLALLGSRALSAANAGVELAAARIAIAPAAIASGAEEFAVDSGPLRGFTVTVAWNRTDHAEAGATTYLYDVTSVAQSGAFGTPEFVSRRVRARINR